MRHVQAAANCARLQFDRPLFILLNIPSEPLLVDLRPETASHRDRGIERHDLGRLLRIRRRIANYLTDIAQRNRNLDGSERRLQQVRMRHRRISRKRDLSPDRFDHRLAAGDADADEFHVARCAALGCGRQSAKDSRSASDGQTIHVGPIAAMVDVSQADHVADAGLGCEGQTSVHALRVSKVGNQLTRGVVNFDHAVKIRAEASVHQVDRDRTISIRGPLVLVDFREPAQAARDGDRQRRQLLRQVARARLDDLRPATHVEQSRGR